MVENALKKTKSSKSLQNLKAKQSKEKAAKKKKDKDVEKATKNLIFQAEEEKRRREKERTMKFPCCFFIPLDIVMIFFAITDLIYYSIFALVWVILIAYEPFAGRDPKVAHNTTLYGGQIRALIKALRGDQRLYLFDDDDETNFSSTFMESTTTLAPPNWFDSNDNDPQKTSRIFSRIAYHYKDFEQEVDDNCGRDYYEHYLYNHPLDVTRVLFEDMSGEIIISSMVFAGIAGLLLTCVCCFRGHVISKFIIIILWYAQLLPILMTIKVIVMSQSQRLCILEYGMGPTFRGQTCIFIFLAAPLILYKPYELFIWSSYINRFFQNNNGCLTDESYFSSTRVEKRAQKKLLDQELKPAAEVQDFKHRYKPEQRTQFFRKVHKHHHHQHAPPPEPESNMKKIFPWWGSGKKASQAQIKPVKSGSSGSSSD